MSESQSTRSPDEEGEKKLQPQPPTSAKKNACFLALAFFYTTKKGALY